MPITNIDNIHIIYKKEKHIGTHFRVACQLRCLLGIQTFSFQNLGSPSYDYVAVVPDGKRYRIKTREVDITDRIFENVIDEVSVF